MSPEDNQIIELNVRVVVNQYGIILGCSPPANEDWKIIANTLNKLEADIKAKYEKRPLFHKWFGKR